MFPSVNDGVTVRKLTPANPNNSRGMRTYEYHFSSAIQCTTYYRNAGEEFGGHFHKGDDPSKDPEIFQLISGVMVFFLTDKAGGKRTVHIDATDRTPVEVLISPFLLHSARAITDVVYIEFRSTRFDPLYSDIHPVEEF
jgi:oxalate decarboxylase/phosphoglucose isomerase-like protein (cupin superfamily)